MAKGDFKNAKGVLPWKEGDELPEHAINRFRDGGEDAKPYYYRKWVNAQADADKRLELLRRATTGQSYCFICGRYLIPPMIKQDLEVGHLPDCELAEAIDASA